MKKLILNGNVFNPTGIATANREICKELVKLGVKVQTTDIWRDTWDFNIGLEYLNQPINARPEEVVTLFSDYPNHWHDGLGKIYAMFLHEGTVLPLGWAERLNTVEKVFVPSQATKNLFRWNGVSKPIEVIHFGVNEIYKPKKFLKEEELGKFCFLSINSWTGKVGDRKGTDILIKAFDEEFKNEDVKLILKISTFWEKNPPEFYMASINSILGHPNKNILFNSEYAKEEDLVEYYQKSHVFVSPTRGEAFGLTILNAIACGIPVIVTKDRNSGHMDFCQDLDSVLWIDAPEVEQGDPRFYEKGNMLAKPELKSLRKQMRYAYENYKSLKLKALLNSEKIRKEFTWKKTAKKIMEEINGTRN